MRGRRRYAKEKQHKYPPLIQIQTQWRMMVARERIKFRKNIRNRWMARNIQRMYRGHAGRQYYRQKRFVRDAIERFQDDPSCIWGLVQVAMRLHVLRHDWRKLPNGYMSRNSPAAWYRVARKPRLESEGSEGTLLTKQYRGTSVRLFSHALYLLKQDKDVYCIGLFPPQLSASSYVLKLETNLPKGRGHTVSHFFVASMYQLGTSNLRTNIEKKVSMTGGGEKKKKSSSPEKRRRQKMLKDQGKNGSSSRGVVVDNSCTFVIEMFEPDTDRECVPLLVDENIMTNACRHSKFGVGAMEGGRRIIDLRPWVVHNLKLIKTSSAKGGDDSTIHKNDVQHGLKIMSPIIVSFLFFLSFFSFFSFSSFFLYFRFSLFLFFFLHLFFFYGLSPRCSLTQRF